MPLAAGTRLGPYELLAPLGAGGMGEVYRARDTRLGREVAVKVLPAALSGDAERLRRFEKEARSASSLNHPNIVTIYDVGTADSVSYIAMELVEGKTLRELIHTWPLPLRKLLALAAQISDGLAKAHEAGIVHRDLKPENIVVAKDGTAKILDFGLVKLTHAGGDPADENQRPTLTRGTESGVVLGTVGYMSPEQASGNALDFRSDQFSFGAMLYEMVAGKGAFERGTAPEVLVAIIREEPEPLASIAPSTPVPLAWIVERCLAKEPVERYASTRDLARDLARLRDGLAESSGSGSALAVGGRRPVPRRWPVAAALLGILAGIGIGVLAARRSRGEPPAYHRLTFRRGTVGNARFAPDGQTVLYSARFEGKEARIYSTRLDSTEATALHLPAASLVSISDAGKVLIDVPSGETRTLAEVSLAGGAPREILESHSTVRSFMGEVTHAADFAPGAEGFAVVHRVNDRDRLEFPIGRVLYDAGPRGGLYCPRVSPKGDRIAFFESEAAGAGFSVAVVDLTGKKRTLTRDWGDMFGLAWNPKTGEVWFSGRQTGADTGRSFLHAVSQDGRLRTINVGGRIACVKDISRDGRVLLVDADLTTQLVGLPPGATKEVDLSWADLSEGIDLSADGKTILLAERGFAAGVGGAAFIRKTDGSDDAKRLGEGYPIALSADGKWAAVVPLPLRDRLILLPTGAGEPRTLRNEGMTYSFPFASWLPDGRRIVFAGHRSGQEEALFVQDLDGGNARPVTPLGAFRANVENWPVLVSPDGKFVAARGPGDTVFLYPIEGGQPRPVPGIRPTDFLIRWDERGEALFLAAGRRPPLRIDRLEVSSGRRAFWRELAPADPVGVYWAMWALLTPDGKSYAYTVGRNLSALYAVDGLK